MSEPEDQDQKQDSSEPAAIIGEAKKEEGRGYADYWHYSDGPIAEVGVANILADHLTHTEGRSWKSLESLKDDPPDVLLVSTSLHRVGVEVTELVDQKTLERHLGASGLKDWAVWTSDTVAHRIVQLIEQKDRKLAARTGQFDEVFVAVFTDEPMITVELAQQALLNVSVSVANIQRAFLILSYHPEFNKNQFPQGIPVFSVQLRRA